MRLGHVTAIGWKAHAALRATGGAATVVAPLSASIYVRAGGEIVWLGPGDAPPHPRAILCADRGATDHHAPGDTLVVDVAGVTPLPPVRVAMTDAGAAVMRQGCRTLVASIARVGAPDGFGALLAGARLAFPLHGAGDAARTLAAACRAGDADGAARAALDLLGLGAGLTPSGDDYVGAAFFARALLVPVTGDPAGWRSAAAAVREAASARTHPISAALLGDLLDGEGHAPLHDLAHALARGRLEPAFDAARRLASVGHTSGWDLLAGFAAGCGALG